MTPHDRMLHEWSIRRAIEQYCRYLDDGLYEPLLSLFAEHATFTTMGQVLAGRAAIGAFLGPGSSQQPPRPRTAHMISNCLVELDGEDATAETDWAMVRRVGDGQTIVELAGRYRDRLRLIDDSWLFVERTAVAMARPRVPTQS
jgi:3-phenylpropionate/cinnamic acid dioxygenase small subunit